MSGFSWAFWVIGGLLLGMFAFMELGRRMGVRRLREDPQGAQAGAGVIDGAFFGLLALLIAFTFSGAASRFDDRRHLVTEEANDIGTAWLRIDLVPAEAQEPLRQLFRDYADSRLATYRLVHQGESPEQEIERSRVLQDAIWKQSVAATRDTGSPVPANLLLPALNDMIDITTTRTAVTMMHPPAIIFVLLFVLAFAGSLLAGAGMAPAKSRSWVHVAGFAVLLTFTVYVILDLEFPRAGFIRVDAIDQLLVEVRRSMG